jgi:hypothetical protein
MVGRGHIKETVGVLNVNSIHLNTFFDGMSWSYQRNGGVVKCKLYTLKQSLFKCIDFTFNNPTVSLV